VQGALDGGGKVLVHCMQGVSRSVTFVIAFLMWRQKASYEQVFEAVKSIRGVANPNIGFCFQVHHESVEIPLPGSMVNRDRGKGGRRVTPGGIRVGKFLLDM